MSQSPPGVDMSEWMDDRRPRIPRERVSSSSSAASNRSFVSQAPSGFAQSSIRMASEDEKSPEDNTVPEDEYASEKDSASSENNSVSENIQSVDNGNDQNSASVSRRSSGNETYKPSHPSSSDTSDFSSCLDPRNTIQDDEIAQSSSDACSESAGSQDSNTLSCLHSLPTDQAFDIFATSSYDQVAEQFNLDPDSISTYVSKTVRAISRREDRPRWEVKHELNHRRKENGIIDKIDDHVGIREYKKHGERTRRHGPRTNRDDVWDAASESSECEVDEQEAPPEQEPSPEQGASTPPEARYLSMESLPESSQAADKERKGSSSSLPKHREDQGSAASSTVQEPNALVEAMQSLADGQIGVRRRIVVGGTVFWHENVPVTIVHEK